MASTFTTSFGIEKIGTGEQAGSWGTTTNHNADILDRIASYKAVGLSGTTHTLTVREASPGAGTENLQDGMYRVIKFTGALGANNTVTIAPNTSSAWFIFENATTDSGSSGPYSVILSQGSGANITLQNGKNAIVYCDGAGSGAAVFNALNDLQMATLEVTGAGAVDGALTVGGTTTAVAITASGLVTAGAKIDMNGTELILDADADTSITADTDDTIDIRIAGADDFQFTANTFTAQSGSTIAAQALTATTVTASAIVTANASIDLNGTELILDADADTSITADTDDTIDIRIAGADDFQFTANTFTAVSGSTIATNTIAETTAASGVTIDGLLIKDSTAAFADGAVATPSITNTGDLNTGIYFPAADTVGVVTGGVEQFRFGSNPISGKNLVQNGAMKVAQRGTLTGLGAAQAYTSADMWNLFIETTAARVTTSVETAPAAMIADGFANALKIDVTTVDSSPADSDFIGVEQRFEGQNLQHLLYGTAGAKELTVSFWFQSPKSGTHIVYLVQNDGNYGCPMQFTVASADTAEKFSVTFPALTTAGQDFDDDANFSMALGFPLMSNGYESTANQWNSGGTWRSTSAQQNLVDNTANNIYIAGVQLEVGSVATDFEHEDIGTTLAKCKRYLFRLEGTSTNVAIGQGYCQSSTEFRARIRLPVEMRATPTGSQSGAGATSVNVPAGRIAATGTSTSGASKYMGTLVITTAGSLTTGQGGTLEIDTTSDWVQWSAEL
jgi:hypothetical protein